MAYADQPMSGSRITALIIVALIHVVVIYGLVTGLAFSAAKKIIQRVTTINIEEEVKKEETPPPPPPKPTNLPPPPKDYIPPPIAPPVMAPAAPAPPPPPPPPPLAPPAPPPPRFSPTNPVPRGNPGSWATSNDYPGRALREEREGTTSFRVTVGPDGKVTGCSVTGSSGSPELDAATCSLVTRRARFAPAKDGEGNPTSGSYSNRVRWVIPKD
jgi:protein TonB